MSSLSSVFGLILFFSLSLLLLTFFLSHFPPLPSEHAHKLTLPRSLEDARGLRDVLTIYVEQDYTYTLLGMVLVYIFLQTFSIPGSIFLNVVAGAIFGMKVGLVASQTAACCGASMCYLISSLIGKSLAEKWFPERLQMFRGRIHEHRGNLFHYMLFLRLTPFLPNWFINLTSPILGVPYFTFLSATFLGILPAVALTVQAGATVKELATGLSTSSLFVLMLLGFASLIPVSPPFRRFVDSLQRPNAAQKEE